MLTWIKNLYSLFSNLKSVLKLIAFIKEIKKIKDAYPGVQDEILLRAWIVTNVSHLTAFTQTTGNVVDDALAYYVGLIIENDETWGILYHTLCLVTGQSSTDDGAVYGTCGECERIARIIEGEQLVAKSDNPLFLTHEQLTQIASSVVLATVAQMEIT
jgi:hypothetical protein